jgi:hypothetical protein
MHVRLGIGRPGQMPTFELGAFHGSRLPPESRRESRLEAVIMMATYQRHHHLEWIDSDGGPLILLSRELLTAWSGVDPQEPGDDEVQAHQETDYDRVGAVSGYIGLLAVAAGQGVVFWGEPMATAWVSLATTSGIFVRWSYGEEQTDVIGHLKRMEERIWESSGLTFVVGRQPLYLFDAAWPGQEVPEYLTVTLDEGTYAIDTGIARPDNHSELVVHGVRRL